MNKKDGFTSIIALGGLGEVGKNMYAIMHDEEIIIIDAGVMFPEYGLLGIDYVLADYTFLKENLNWNQQDGKSVEDPMKT